VDVPANSSVEMVDQIRANFNNEDAGLEGDAKIQQAEE